MFYDCGIKKIKVVNNGQNNIVTSKLHNNLCLFFAGDSERNDGE